MNRCSQLMMPFPFLIKNCSVSDFLKKNRSFYEKELLSSIESQLKDGGTFIDIGAHVGNHSLYFLQNTSANVMSFEPNPEAYRALAANIYHGEYRLRAQAFNIAIADKEADGILSPENPKDAGTMTILWPEEKKDGVKVKIRPLDSFIKQIDEDVKLIKIDTEGCEVSVLEGAKKIIKKYYPVICAESRTVEEFSNVYEILSGIGYYPQAIYNATPTIVWQYNPDKEQSEVASNVDTFKYAIGMASRTNNLSMQVHSKRAKFNEKDKPDAAATSRGEAQSNKKPITDALSKAIKEEAGTGADLLSLMKKNRSKLK